MGIRSQAEIETVRIFSEEDYLEQVQPVQVGLSSILGTRKNQQDYIFGQFHEGNGIAVVCDGMGGLKGGEIASRTAVEKLVTDYMNGQPIRNIPAFFEEEAYLVDEAVCGLRDHSGASMDAGTTLVSVIIEDGKLYWLSVGDSKLYIIRKQEIVTVNRLHNYRMTMDQMLKEGTMTQEEYRANGKRAEALISYMGMGNVSLMDINREPFALQEGDAVLLTSDGLYRSLTDSMIMQIIHSHPYQAQEAAECLTASAMQHAAGGQDNTSLILIYYKK